MDEEDDEVYEINRDSLLRQHIFSKVKKRPRYNSALKLNIIKNENSLNYVVDNESNDYDNDNDNDNDSSSKDNKIFVSSSFVKRNKKKLNFN